MSTKRRPSAQAKATCRRKVRFEDELEASVALEAMVTKHPETTDALVPYRCPICRRWHLGNRRDEQ